MFLFCKTEKQWSSWLRTTEVLLTMSFTPTETQMEMWAPGATWQSMRTASTGSTARYLLARVRLMRSWRFWVTEYPECRGEGHCQRAGSSGLGISRSWWKEKPSWAKDSYLSCWGFSEMGISEIFWFPQNPIPLIDKPNQNFASTWFPHAESFITEISTAQWQSLLCKKRVLHFWDWIT